MLFCQAFNELQENWNKPTYLEQHKIFIEAYTDKAICCQVFAKSTDEHFQKKKRHFYFFYLFKLY